MKSLLYSIFATLPTFLCILFLKIGIKYDDIGTAVTYDAAAITCSYIGYVHENPKDGQELLQFHEELCALSDDDYCKEEYSKLFLNKLNKYRPERILIVDKRKHIICRIYGTPESWQINSPSLFREYCLPIFKTEEGRYLLSTTERAFEIRSNIIKKMRLNNEEYAYYSCKNMMGDDQMFFYQVRVQFSKENGVIVSDKALGNVQLFKKTSENNGYSEVCVSESYLQNEYKHALELYFENEINEAESDLTFDGYLPVFIYSRKKQ